MAPADAHAHVREIDLHLTNRCNLTCAHCSVDSGAGRTAYGEMGFDAWSGVIDNAAWLGVRYCDLTGGEPLLHPDVEAIVARIASHGMRSQLQSNGMLVNERRLRPLIDAGLGTLVISLDGDWARHDAIRGLAGSHRAGLVAIATGVRLGIPVRVTRVVVRDEHIESIAEFARQLDEIGIDHLSLNYFSPVTPRHFEGWRIPDAERWLTFTRDVEVLAKRVRYPISYEVGFARADDADAFFGEETRCLIQRRRWFLIRCDGEVFPCYHFVHSGAMSLGNVRRDPLSAIVGTGNAAWRRYEDVERVPAACADCKHAGTCGGGCPSPGYLRWRDLALKDPRCQVDRGFVPVCPFIKRTAGTPRITNIAPYYEAAAHPGV